MAGQFNYARTAATASRLLKRFGQGATLRQSTAGTGPDPGPPVTVNYPCTVVVDNYSSYDRAGTQIEANDRRVLISVEGLPVKPGTSDKLIIGGAVFRILAVDAVEPGGTAVLYTAQCRT